MWCQPQKGLSRDHSEHVQSGRRLLLVTFSDCLKPNLFTDVTLRGHQGFTLISQQAWPLSFLSLVLLSAALLPCPGVS